tara:strand:- start:14529 stop:15041 length:513 start_codon:yes stop_codon:yes gene_type:complete
MNSRIIFAGFAVAAGVALWLSQPGRIDALRNDQMSTRCAMIQAAITSLDRGELATVTESGDVSRGMERHSPLAVQLSWADDSRACPDMPPTIWMNPVGQIIQDSAAPDRPISENDPYFYFGRHETGPFDRAGSLELNYFCSALCGQYWRLELARTREGWQVIDIQHTGSS